MAGKRASPGETCLMPRASDLMLPASDLMCLLHVPHAHASCWGTRNVRPTSISTPCQAARHSSPH